MFNFKTFNYESNLSPICYFILKTEDRHANAKAHEAVDHLTSFLSSREEISQPCQLGPV